MQDTVYGIIADSEEPARHTERERERKKYWTLCFSCSSRGKMSKQMQIMSNKKKKKTHGENKLCAPSAAAGWNNSAAVVFTACNENA